MPSGNATITYTGDEPEITFSGQTFTQGEPTHSADQGVIGGLKDRDDFAVIDHRAEAEANDADEQPAEPVAKPAKKAAKK